MTFVKKLYRSGFLTMAQIFVNPLEKYYQIPITLKITGLKTFVKVVGLSVTFVKRDYAFIGSLKLHESKVHNFVVKKDKKPKKKK